MNIELMKQFDFYKNLKNQITQMNFESEYEKANKNSQINEMIGKIEKESEYSYKLQNDFKILQSQLKE
jgi:hypothetical protein